MHRTRLIPVLALAAALAACKAEVETPEKPAKAPEASTAPAAPAGEGPAGEVPPDTREATAPAANLPEGVDAAWAPYYAHIPFVFGSEAGFAKAKETGRPMMLFYAATW